MKQWPSARQTQTRSRQRVPWALRMGAAVIPAALLAACGGADQSGTAATGTQALPPLASAVTASALCPGSSLPACRLPLRMAHSALAGWNPTAEAAFAWAEAAYPELFAPATAPGVPPQTSGPFVYRYYAGTGNYLALAGGSVYVLGPLSAGKLTLVGELASFSCNIEPLVCGVGGAQVLTGLHGLTLPSLGTVTMLPQALPPDATVTLTLASGPKVDMRPDADGQYRLPLLADRTQALITVAQGSTVVHYATVTIEPLLPPVPAGSIVRGYLRASLEAAEAVLPLIPASQQEQVAAGRQRVAFLRESLAMVNAVMDSGATVVGPDGTTLTATDLRLQDMVLAYALQQTGSGPSAARASGALREGSVSAAEAAAYQQTVRNLAELERFNNTAQAILIGIGAAGTAMVILGSLPIVIGGVVVGAGVSSALVATGTTLSTVVMVNSLALNAATAAQKTYYGDVSGFSRKDEIVGMLTALATQIGFNLRDVERGLKTEVGLFVGGLANGPYPGVAQGIVTLTQEGWTAAIDNALGGSYSLLFPGNAPVQPPPAGCTETAPTVIASGTWGQILKRPCARLVAGGSVPLTDLIEFQPGAADTVLGTVTLFIIDGQTPGLTASGGHVTPGARGPDGTGTSYMGTAFTGSQTCNYGESYPAYGSIKVHLAGTHMADTASVGTLYFRYVTPLGTSGSCYIHAAGAFSYALTFPVAR